MPRNEDEMNENMQKIEVAFPVNFPVRIEKVMILLLELTKHVPKGTKALFI